MIRFRGRDAYGRILGRVIADGTDVGLTQLTNGNAWYVKSEAPQLTPQARKRYPAAEAAAKKNRIGLWADPKPVSPWEFRKGTGASELKTFEEKSEVKQPDGFSGGSPHSSPENPESGTKSPENTVFRTARCVSFFYTRAMRWSSAGMSSLFVS